MRRKRIAVLMAGLDREYQQDFALGMASECAKLDVDLCVFNCMGYSDSVMVRSDAMENAIFELPDLSTFDGVVALCYTIASQEALGMIQSLLSQVKGKPMVTIDMPVDYAVEVTFDDVVSVREMILHLIHEHHERRFALVTGPAQNKVAITRNTTSRRLIEENGCTVTDVFDGSWTRDGGIAAAERLLHNPAGLPDVVVCDNDDMALGVIERFREAGVQVPHDVRVTGFDARKEAVGYGLTTILRPVNEAGRTTVDLLVDWINGVKPTQRSYSLPTRVIYGRSCGCVMEQSVAMDLIRLLTDERRRTENSLLRASGFSSSLAGVSGLEEAGRVIAAFAGSWQAEEMHICVAPDFLSPDCALDQRGYPWRMLLLSSYSHGRQARQQAFDTQSLVPVLDRERDHPLALVFCPLYYVDKKFGYAVFDLEHATGFALYSLLTLLGGALMSLRLQNTVRAYAAALENASVHDPLTGLYNRRGFNQLGPELFARAQQQGRCFCVISCDMDGMKDINDHHGHLAGDKAIVRMGTALTVLESEGLTCIHISGDEFIALGPVASVVDAAQMVEVLKKSIEDINRNEPWICDIAASIGYYAAVPHENDTLDEFMSLADSSMYSRKTHRRR